MEGASVPKASVAPILDSEVTVENTTLREERKKNGNVGRGNIHLDFRALVPQSVLSGRERLGFSLSDGGSGEAQEIVLKNMSHPEFSLFWTLAFGDKGGRGGERASGLPRFISLHSRFRTHLTAW